MILATFSSCCCYEFWLPFPPASAEAFAAAAAGPQMGKHHCEAGVGGNRIEKLATPAVSQNYAQKLPNVTSETTENADFSYCFLLFPPAAAAAPAPATPSVQNAPAGWEGTMAVKDGEAHNGTPKMPNVTSET